MTSENNPDIPYGSGEHARLVAYGRHPDVRSALAWLAFTHLPPSLQVFARLHYGAAVELIRRIPNDSPELTTALNTLVEAKDWTVRAGIRNDFGRPGPVARPAVIVDPPTITADKTDLWPPRPTTTGAGRASIIPTMATVDLPPFDGDRRYRHADGTEDAEA